MDSWDPPPSFSVPLDVVFEILSHLSLADILSLRQTCKSFLEVTYLRSLWVQLYRVHVTKKNIPTPGLDDRPIDSLAAHELEYFTRRALTLRRNWTRPDPQKTRKLSFLPTTDPNSRITFLQFLPGRSHRWLIAITMSTMMRKFTIQCWDVGTSQPKCVAELMHVEGPFGGVAINSDSTSPITMAMQFAQTELFSIDFEADDPDDGFESLATIDGIRELRALSGSTLVTKYPDGDLCVWSLDDIDECPEREIFRLKNPLHATQPEGCQAVRVYKDCIIVVRTTTLEVYSLPPYPANSLYVPTVFPITQHRWQWQTDSVYVAEQVSWEAIQYNKPAPINIFIRFNSGFPWPVNLIHHFVVAPNPRYTRQYRACAANPPYLTTPIHVQSLASPIRLFAVSSLALGPYGSAIWTDSHTEDRFPPNAGQRLAGAMAYWQDSDRTGTTLSVGRGSMVFEVLQDDTWTRVAMTEEEGKVVLGGLNGEITLFEYA